LRRLLALTVVAAALVTASLAAAGLQPVRRDADAGEVSLPRLRAGVVRIPPGHRSGRVTVIVRLRLPPLAAARGRGLQTAAAGRRLDVRSASSRAYLARLARAQRAAVTVLRRAIPEATVTRRYRVVLDGMAVSLPVRRLPELMRLRLADRVYPSLRYAATTNESPSVIAAEVLRAATGATGEGVKIGVVDTGIDTRHPFLDPSRFSYPPGFPKGGKKWTTAKIIVARAFPGPGSGRQGRLAFHPLEPHGTHVAGIAAGSAGTDAPAGRDHPAVSGLAGVAPGAWIGNYRVFTIPAPFGQGHVGATPEIVAAFEAAVRDGMDVINFSGGAPEIDPMNDAIVEAVANVAAAGVVPVIAIGNDRDEFGLGTAGSPGTAPEAIGVAAVSNLHVFSAALSVVSPGAPSTLKEMPFRPAPGGMPRAWRTDEQALVDVATIVGRDGDPVDRKLCGPSDNLEAPTSTLPRGSLQGAIALVARGTCSFVSKAFRARQAGAIGIVVIDNRAGEPNRIPVALPLPGGMVSDLDGSRLREFVDASGGRALVGFEGGPLQIETGRSGIVTSFSGAGPTSFGHALKPDVSAPGGEVLSSVTGPFDPSRFSVFDGTSMATPHVAGAAALLVQRHHWSPRQIKSALVSTAGPAWADTARTVEAPVILEGGGLVHVARADDPRLFTDPASLSFGDLDVTGGARRRTSLLTVSDAGGGAGTWQIELRPQSASPGATLELPATVDVPPGGSVEIAVGAHAVADASSDGGGGLNYGFVVLRRGDLVRRVPYLFLVTRPRLALHQPRKLQRFQAGNTRLGDDLVRRYRFPTTPFGPNVGGAPMEEDGAERVYFTFASRPLVNLGAAVVASSENALIHPWLLGSLDENDVEGIAGTPVNANNLTPDFRADLGAAGAVFVRPQRFFVSVDSGRLPFSELRLAGRYVLRAWRNDVTPPRLRLLTTRVSAGRPLLVARATDAGAGVNPLSLLVAYRGVLLGAAFYDPGSGIALFPIPRQAPKIRPGKARIILVASDYQEAKNISTISKDAMPNTRFLRTRMTGGRGPTVTWLFPRAGKCVGARERLVVAAGATRPLTAVRFRDGSRPIDTVRRGQGGLFGTTWRSRRARRGRHVLEAVAVDRSGARARSTRPVRVCR
jgi:minor extracellular serine protease Vpr